MTWYDANLKNIVCYSRHKFNMLADLQKLYKAYLAGELGVTEQPQGGEELSCESTFCDNFDTNWFIDNNFTNEYREKFDTQWFIDNNYLNLWDEDFEDTSWD